MSPATLSTPVLAAAPGRDVGCDVHLTNPTGDALTVDVEVEGPAAEWAVVLPPALTVAPGASGRARVNFTVPDCGRLAGSTRQFAVKVTGGTPVELAGRIDIAEVQDLRLSLRPLVSRARGTTTHTLTVDNRGTRSTRAALVVHQTDASLSLHLVDDQVDVAPGEQATVEVQVAPRRRLLAGRSRPHRFSVEARPETGPPVTAEATCFQDPVRWRRGAAAAALAIGVASAGAVVLVDRPTSNGSPLAGAVPATVTPPALTPACTTRAAAGPLALDIAGFAFCPATATVPVGVEVVWTNGDLAPHTVTYDGPDGPVDSGSMVQGQSWSTRFGQAGTYRYYCRFHPGMTGTIVVASSG